MVRLDQEWCYMAMRIMNVQIVLFVLAEKLKECVGSMYHTIERIDRQTDRQRDRVIRNVRITQTVTIPQKPSHILYLNHHDCV
jgi:hypothetical protein